MNPRLSLQQRQDMVFDYLDGVPSHEIAARYGVVRSYPGKLARRGGRFRHSLTMERRQEIARLYHEGIGCKVIAARFGISVSTVSAWALAQGCERRKRHA